MTVRVLTDAIHADLLESLAILVEDRLGWELYSPGGMEWFDSGTWRFERERLGDAVARQFLEPWATDSQVTVVDGSPSYALRPGTMHPRYQRRLSLSEALDLKPDLVISTLAENDAGLKGFADSVGAHFGVQVGNQGQPCAWTVAEFALLTATTPGMVPWMPHVYYHQEFSLETFAADGGALAEPDLVMTRVQCPTGVEGYDRFQAAAALVPGSRFRWYGHCGEPDALYGGNASSVVEIGQQMHQARVAWHWKRWSDGYGHVIHNWFAIGRPVLATSAYYADKLAGPLFIEGRTSWDITDRSPAEIAALVERFMADDDAWRQACIDSATRFREVVNFDEEADEIREMLERVLS